MVRHSVSCSSAAGSWTTIPRRAAVEIAPMIATGIAISSGHGVAITTKSAAKAAGPRPPVEVTSRAAPTGPRQTSRRSWPPGTTRARTRPKSRPGTESVGSRPFATSVPSTYNRLARRHAGNPALAYGTVIATGSGMARIRRVMYTTDLSTASRRAFGTAITLAKGNRHADDRARHRPDRAARSGGVPGHEHVGANRRAGATMGRHSLGAARRKGPRPRPSGNDAALRRRPSRHIVKAARAMRTDVVVMGTHGRTGFSRLLLGSVAERVIAAVACPVVVVRGT